MQGSSFVGVLFGLLAGLVNGIFLLPMRYTRCWAWENTWLLFTIFSTGALPCIFTYIVFPGVVTFLRGTALLDLLPGLIAGLLWGIAQVAYGRGVGILGVAIGSAVISSASTLAGVLGPLLVYSPKVILTPAIGFLCCALVLLISGILEYARAGHRREEELQGVKRPEQLIDGKFRTGLAICLATGVLGTAFVYGGRSSTHLVASAISHGAPPVFSFYVAYMVTFNAGLVPGLVYSLYKMKKNGTFIRLRTLRDWPRNAALALLMATLWYSGIILYGTSAQQIGRFGPSIAFALFGGGTILFANLFGWLAGEWRGASRKTILGFVRGMALVVVGIIAVDLAHFL